MYDVLAPASELRARSSTEAAEPATVLIFAGSAAAVRISVEPGASTAANAEHANEFAVKSVQVVADAVRASTDCAHTPPLTDSDNVELTETFIVTVDDVTSATGSAATADNRGSAARSGEGLVTSSEPHATATRAAVAMKSRFIRI